MKLMLQSLLADRFKLTTHREIREVPVYAIVISRKGNRLQKSRVDEKDCDAAPSNWDGISCHSMQGGVTRGLHGEAVDLSDVALWVENWTDRPVVDRAGLTGLFNIQTEGWSPMQGPVVRSDSLVGGGDKSANDSDRPTLFALLEGLGLEMLQARAPIEILVIDHIQRPTQN